MVNWDVTPLRLVDR